MNKWIILLSILIVIAGAIYFGVVRSETTKVISFKDEMTGKSVRININKGKHYLHDFKINSLLSIKTPPQIAIWIEDSQGNYLETLFATNKIVKQGWSKAPADSAQKITRPEALPYWTYKRNNKILKPDVVSSATPKGSSEINTKLDTSLEQFTILAEVNMSTDFNEYYPKEAKPGEDNYSGGEFGSGQPALVYAASIDSTDKTTELKLIGHSSPDGRDNKLYHETAQLTTAKEIVQSITFVIK